MKVRETNVTDSDRRSARIFFEAMAQFWDLRQAHALDAFARNGQLTVQFYRAHVGKIDVWELGEEHRPALERMNPHDVKIGDSYALAEAADRKYDMIVIDTPQGAHHDSQGAVHFEHFDFYRLALEKLAAERAIIVLYVNKAPYDKNKEGSHGYDEYAEYDFEAWMKARGKFYECPNPYDLTEEAVICAYREEADVRGWNIGQVLAVPCFSDVPGKEPYAFRLALECIKGKQ